MNSGNKGLMRVKLWDGDKSSPFYSTDRKRSTYLEDVWITVNIDGRHVGVNGRHRLGWTGVR